MVADQALGWLELEAPAAFWTRDVQNCERNGLALGGDRLSEEARRVNAAQVAVVRTVVDDALGLAPVPRHPGDARCDHAHAVATCVHLAHVFGPQFGEGVVIVGGSIGCRGLHGLVAAMNDLHGRRDHDALNPRPARAVEDVEHSDHVRAQQLVEGSVVGHGAEVHDGIDAGTRALDCAVVGEIGRDEIARCRALALVEAPNPMPAALELGAHRLPDGTGSPGDENGSHATTHIFARPAGAGWAFLCPKSALLVRYNAPVPIRTLLPVLSLSTALAACSGGLQNEPQPGQRVTPQSPGDPGRVTLHRLNRAEYNNTVRDLLGTTLRPADRFPSDGHGFGFDNVASVLTLSPSQLQLYERAADVLVEELFAAPPDKPFSEHIEGENIKQSAGTARAKAFNLGGNAELGLRFELPASGTYRVTIHAWGEQAGSEPARLRLRAGETELGVFDVGGDAAAPVTIERDAPLSAGSSSVGLTFVNDFSDKGQKLDRNLLIDWVEVQGPLAATDEAREKRARILSCDVTLGGAACMERIVADFAFRSFRRPLRPGELDRLKRLAATESDPREGLKLALKAVLLAPQFLFRTELDTDPNSPIVKKLDGYELASRLSYFLWSTMPDETLFADARRGELDEASGLEREVSRMLADPKSAAFVESFGGQWLLTRALGEHEADGHAYPEFDPALKEALARETELFLSEFLRDDHPVEELVTADYTYVNARLARHYGVPAPSSGFARVEFKNGERGGLLRMGAVLTVTSLPHRSSPVKRGKWVLGQLLCSEPPPPPPGVVTQIDDKNVQGSLSELLAAHRQKPECAVCHNAMDPIGLALENYDGIGHFRVADRGKPIEAVGKLPDGAVIAGASGLVGTLGSDPRFAACVSKKLYTYALSRGLEPQDDAELAALSKEIGPAGFSLRDLIVNIVQSPPFRFRRGEPALAEP